MQTTARYDSLPVYLLATIPQKKRDLIARGVDVIDLGAGDADLAAPPAAVQAIIAAVQEPGMSRYGFGLGLPRFREAVSAWMEKRFGHRFDPLKEIVPLIGSKEGIAHFCLATLQKGDVAIIPDPGYLAYLGGTLLAEAEPYLYPITPRTNFLVEIDDIPADILTRAKVLFLNYPNNPTAAIAPTEYLARMVKRCKELGIILVFDNAYSEMTFDGYVAPSIFDIPGARDVAIEFHSLSKTYNMTGWRCGWACGWSWDGAGRGRPAVMGSVEHATIAASVEMGKTISQAAGVVQHLSNAHQGIASVKAAIRLPAGQLNGDCVKGGGVVDHGSLWVSVTVEV